MSPSALHGARLVALASIAVAAPAFGQLATERDAPGKAVFDHWCAPCHAPGPRHPGTQALEVLYQGAKPGALEARDDLVPELTRAFVRTGVSIMPPFRKTEISDAELETLARYLAPAAR